MDIDVNEILSNYKERLSNTVHENVVLLAQVSSMSKTITTLEERLARLENNETSESDTEDED